MKEIKNKILNVEAERLHVFCFDSIEVTDRTTFDSCVVNGLQVTFWMEDENTEERINKMFDLFFDELVKTGNKRILSVLEQ
jgi:hypothetical protein